jgi:hypothetical protein
VSEDLFRTESAKPARAAWKRRFWSPQRSLAFLRVSIRRVDPGVWAILAVFLSLTVPRLSTVPMWDSRIYYDRCLMDSLRFPFDLLNLNCFGHPSMLYMILLVPGQLLDAGNAVLLNLTNVVLGSLSICAFWVLTTVLIPAENRRSERLLATGLFAVWPASIGSCLSVGPDYGVLAFFLLYLALLLTDHIEAAAVAGLFLVLSKEFGVLLYGLTTALFITIRFFHRRDASIRRSWRAAIGKRILFAPAILYVAVSGAMLAQPGAGVWGGAAVSSRALSRFVFFNPAELFFGPFGPLIWVLSFSWILSVSLVALPIALSISSRARNELRAIAAPRPALLFLVLLFAGAVLALTRYETFANVRYLLPIAPLLILTSVVLLEVTVPWAVLRRATLGIVFLLLLASNFRTLDPVSRTVWGTFSFGRHRLLRMTSWTDECCGYGRDQLVYNLEYLKFHELQNAMFRDIRPRRGTTFASNNQADWFLGGRVTPDGERSLRLSNTIRVHYADAGSLEQLRAPPATVYFVAFPNFDNGKDFQELRRNYFVASVKFYERSGYSIPVYTLRRKPPRAAAIAPYLQRMASGTIQNPTSGLRRRLRTAP